MKVVYIAAPLSAPTAEEMADNRARAARWAAWAFYQGVSPVCSWIVLTGEIPDDNVELRKRGLEVDCAHVERCDALWLVAGRVSTGMGVEADHARKFGVAVHDLTHLGAEPPALPPVRTTPFFPEMGPTRPQFPQQPLFKDERGKIRFKENPIVSQMLDWGREGERFDLNRISLHIGDGSVRSPSFPREAYAQLMQLIGYSVAGYHELGMVRDAEAFAASAEARRLGLGVGAIGCRDNGCEIHGDAAEAEEAGDAPREVSS